MTFTFMKLKDLISYISLLKKIFLGVMKKLNSNLMLSYELILNKFIKKCVHSLNQKQNHQLLGQVVVTYFNGHNSDKFLDFVNQYNSTS